MRNNILSNLEARILVFFIPILILIIVIGGVLLRTFLADLIISEYQESLLDASETIEFSLHYDLMKNDFEETQQVILNMGHQGRTDVIRLINLKGVIRASSLADEVGVSLNMDSKHCQGCHLSKTSIIPSAKRMPALNQEKRVLVTAQTIENRVACQRCHGEERKILGVILAEHPIAPIDDRMAGLDLGLLGVGFAIVIATSGIVTLQLRRQVVTPLNWLVSGKQEKDLIERSDSIGRLASRLVKSDEDLIAQDSLLEFQRKSFDALLSISEATGEDPSVRMVFRHVLKALREATDFVSIGMRLYVMQSNCFKLVDHYGISPAMLEVLNCIPQDQGFQAQAMKKKWPVFTSDIASANHLVGRTALDLDYRSLICVPLIVGDQVIGTMELVTDQEHIWREDEVRWLALFGRSVGVLIRNVQLNNRLRDMTVLQERSRLAQEIHDGLAQLIGSLRLWAEEAQISLEDKKLASVRVALDKIQTTARDAYSSIREEMLGLRDTIVPGEDFVSVVTEYLSRFQRQWGIESKLFYQDGKGSADHLPISPTAEIQLLRIVQEGLTNIRRHAEATHVEVTIEELEDSLFIVIQDDGKGFNPEQISDENLGLRIMRERAASVGGLVHISSEPNLGTNLQIEIPIHDR
jgi:signal transduction histidine kinase